jgi:hypothetical protein
MDLATLRSRLRKRIGNPDTSDVTDADLTDIINQAYKDIADRFRFHQVRRLCSFDTVSGSKNYELPSALVSIINVRDRTSGDKLTKTDLRDDASQESEDDDDQGQPLYYIRLRNFIRLEPTPDGVYKIEIFYKAGITDLSADGDSPILPDPWHEGILKLARHYYYDQKPDVAKAQYALQMYQSWVSTKPVEVDEEKKDLDKGVVIPTLQRATILDFDRE